MAGSVQTPLYPNPTAQPSLRPGVAGGPTPFDVLQQGGSWSQSNDNPSYPGQQMPAPTYHIPQGGGAGAHATAQPAAPQAPGQPFSQLNGLASSYISSALSGAPGPYTPPALHPGPTAPATPPHYDPAAGPGADALKASNDATYAHAKDEAGNTARAALTGLQGELQARGMGGAGYEGGQIGQTLSREANTIGAASRQNAQTLYDQGLQRANTTDQLNVSQRGQDIGADTSRFATETGANEYANSLQVQQQALQQQRQTAALNALLQMNRTSY